MTQIDDLPYIRIPCESVEALKDLVDILYKKHILIDETICFGNCPENINEILSKEKYFDVVEIAGIKLFKGLIDVKTKDLL